ncbi:hypothetical protein, partial [Klebsiella pneumoniae]|uniref:hypothetical protein n=1 Tax=Klebsiella pneumoniae TaxID=573 RepID=UPI001F4A7503
AVVAKKIYPGCTVGKQKRQRKSEGQGIRKQIKYCERSNIIRIGSFFLFFSTTLNNITYDSHISLFSNWKSHSLNT